MGPPHALWLNKDDCAGLLNLKGAFDVWSMASGLSQRRDERSRRGIARFEDRGVEDLGHHRRGRRFDIPVRTSTSLNAAVVEAAIIITRAETPFPHAARLPNGGHLNTFGAILVDGVWMDWEIGDIAYTAPSWSTHTNGSRTCGAALTVQDHPFQITTQCLVWQEGVDRPVRLLGAAADFRSDDTIELAAAP